MAQPVKCLMDKHEGLSLVLGVYPQKPGTEACTWNLSSGQQKRAGPWNLRVSQPGLLSEL